MKKKFKSRLRSDLFPDMPQSFYNRVTAMVPVQNARERRRRIWVSLASAGIGLAVAASFVFVLGGAMRDRSERAALSDPIAETQAPSDVTEPEKPGTVCGTWELSQLDLNGLLVSAAVFGGENEITISEDGTAAITGTGIYDAEDGTVTVPCTIDGRQITLHTADVLPGTADATYTFDPEQDTLTSDTLSTTMTTQGAKAIFRRKATDAPSEINDPGAFDPKGKWTLTGVELNGYVEEILGLEMYLEFSGDGSVTLTTAMGGTFESETYRYRVSGNTIETLKAIAPDLTLTYDPATDTLRWGSSLSIRSGALIFSRSPDAEIPSSEPEKTDDNIVTSDEDLAALKAKYPEYFGLDTESGLKVFVCEFACDSFSCTLLSGKDKDKSLLDISTMRGTTVGEMLSILLTYDIPSEKIEVIPYVNPLSSYAYTIDALYTSYVTWKIKGGLPYLDAVQFDLDGDGIEELCTLTYGPTSGLFTVTFSVYREGKLLAMNTYNLHYGELYFSKTAEGLKLLHTSQWADSEPQTDVYLVTIQSGRIVWTNEKTGEAFTDYWGDGTWNLDGKDPASIDVSGVTVSSRYLCVGATAGDTLVPIPAEYRDHTHGLELAEGGPQNAADGFVWVKRSYLTAVGSGLSDQAWGSLAPFEGDAPSALRLETELTAENGEPIVLHFALCEQPMDYGFLLEGIADAGPLVPEPTAETLFFADWDEDGVYEYLAYLKLPESGKCLISDGERTLVLEDCVTVRGFYTDLDTKSPYGNLILSTEAADGSKHVYELHPEGGAIVIGNTRNGYCFVDDGILTEDEPYDLCIGEPSPFGSARGYYTVHGDALEPWGHTRNALEIYDCGVDVQRDRDWLIKDGLLLKLKLDMPCTHNGEQGLLEAGTYVYLVNYLDTFTEAKLSTEGGLVVTVTMNGDANDLRIDGVPVSDYFE